MTNKTLLYRGQTGSRLYGTHTEESDIDYGEVYLEPLETLLGIEKEAKLAHLTSDENDRQRHWLRRWCYLCCKGNPNVMEYLFIPDDMVDFVDPAFKSLFLDDPTIYFFKDALLKSHHGFADAQIKRMVKGNDVGKKRKHFVKKYGYDVKFGAHAIRLMYQLREIILTGHVVYPYNPDVRKEIIRVRRGEVTLPEFYKMYEALKEEIRKLEKGTYPHIQEEWDTSAINDRLMLFTLGK